MGPILMLDKSVFQGLAYDEHSYLCRLFKQIFPPVLACEIISNLVKTPKRTSRDRTPPQLVQTLARKFLGSGPTVCVDFRSACLGDLTGDPVPMTGQIPVAHGVQHSLPEGGYGLMLGLHPLNHAVMRWSQGSFDELEVEFANNWKDSKEIRPDRFRKRLHEERVISRRVRCADDLRNAVDRVMGEPAYQRIWLNWLLDEIRVSPDRRARINLRWRLHGEPPLEDYALYATHCVRCMLALDIAVQSGLIPWDIHHRIDLQYLFYLPFCMVFSSRDRLHSLLTPSLMRTNQSYIDGDTLKAELAVLVASNVGIRIGPDTEPLSQLAPTIATLHREHLWGGPKSLRAQNSLL